MKIDYELVEKIGATHYSECGEYYKLDNNKIMHLSGGQECETSNNAWWCVKNLKPIQPKPPVRVEYEKVTESIFDLKDEFERGELYFQQGGEYLPYKLESEFAHGFMHNRIYRRIEKPVDWQNSVVEFMKGCPVDGSQMNQELIDELNADRWDNMTDSDFLEMCRVALRANGEL